MSPIAVILSILTLQPTHHPQPQQIVQQVMPDMGTCLAARDALVIGFAKSDAAGLYKGECIPLIPGTGTASNPYSQEF